MFAHLKIFLSFFFICKSIFEWLFIYIPPTTFFFFIIISHWTMHLNLNVFLQLLDGFLFIALDGDSMRRLICITITGIAAICSYFYRLLCSFRLCPFDRLFFYIFYIKIFSSAQSKNSELMKSRLFMRKKWFFPTFIFCDYPF